MRRFVAVLALLVVVQASIGCRSEKPGEPVPVRGKVVLANGKAVGNVMVRFHPQNPRFALPQQLTNPDGSFEFSCPPGKYHISLMMFAVPQASDPGAPPKAVEQSGMLPSRYLDPGQTPWRDIEVLTEGTSDLKLVVSN